MNDLTFAPGCFGSALTYDETNIACRNCVFAARCRPVHEQNLMALREKLGVTAAPRKKSGPKPKSVGASQSGLVPSKETQALIDRLDASNLRVVENLQKGINPFGDKMALMKIACHLLLKRPISAPLLSAALATKLGWHQKAAELRAYQALAALRHIGAVDFIDGVFILRRTQA